MRCHPGKRLRRFLSEVGEKDELLEPKRTSCCARITSANCANSCWGEQLDTSVASRAGFFWCIFFCHFSKKMKKRRCLLRQKGRNAAQSPQTGEDLRMKWFFWGGFFGESLPVQMAWVYFGWDGGPPPATVTLSEKLEKKKWNPGSCGWLTFHKESIWSDWQDTKNSLMIQSPAFNTPASGRSLRPRRNLTTFKIVQWRLYGSSNI